MPNRLDIKKGDKYNRLTIIKEVEKKGQYRYFKCKCSCGSIKEIRLDRLRVGNTKSCGCLQKETTNNLSHGMTGTRIYTIWKDLIKRCNNPNREGYKNYGGRGITYDTKWRKFEGFYKDMKEGYADNLTIDRKDSNKNYCKDNCRWATMKEQQRNKRNNILYKGRCVAEWCEELGLNSGTVYARINARGWSIEKALELK